ncbi:50S ribosomal protein L11 methyltransferase [Sphingomonas sp. HITSZ_GF]|uniref:50S ribosomal protein L11 methyltransferase n=1 Tax=Sphingomonas sp. HITSZ_GF TaxID=3037247 RepID=UPI00240E0793|nr:50S ribosomal protein L11 methyltransferase [Sphingomonas sp. HITSZ_GF]MDG2533164.1 50S ribosomal protein L11 methyltransferase [Sphingomonas sp. HITSZ_GF]
MSSWKLTLPCTRAEAEAIDADDEAVFAIEPIPVLLTSEVIADDPLAWQLEAYFESKPNSAALAAVQALAPSSKGVKAVAEKIRDADWVTLSQAGIEPVHAGRFYVHTETNKGKVPAGAKAFRIDAGLAFGTGTHETTSGCLLALDRLKAEGKRFENIIDVGTGTGLLAFAALHLWPRAYATASDIDPRAVDVTADNAEINGFRLGGKPGEIALAAAAGVEHPLLLGRAPYDLVIANILAGPLIELAPSLGAVLAEGGTLILAGLLKGQAEDVAKAYRRQGLRLVDRSDRGDWPTLTLAKRVRYGTERVTRLSRGKGEAPGFGSW